MSKLKTKKWTLLYTEINKLGEGGNADVYLVEDSKSGKRYALKELRSSNRSEEKKSRFVSEIQIARDNCTIIPGIIPVIDYSMEDYWYTMPIAQPIMDCVNGKSLDEIIDGVLQLCETLGRLHEKGYIIGILSQAIFIIMMEDLRLEILGWWISQIMMISPSRTEGWGRYLRLHQR